ncbi:MAG TPA: cytochrome c peroxidase, partial [Pseudolabrys sp.]|nr:cytochrome c peroxidase [Pseudolabrys sp.]
LVTYVREISFLPNAKLAAGGRLAGKASAAARRGERLFNKPFPHDASMSCASCHQPTSAFVDHQVHDFGSGGLFKTPTLINANFNAPYFHDGRYDTYGQVVDYFDHRFDLGLDGGQKADLIAYLNAIGDADTPTTTDTVQLEIDELAAFASVLETAIPAHDKTVIALAVDSVGNEWRELGEKFPDLSDTSVQGGGAERRAARAAVRGLVLNLRRISMAASRDDFAAAAHAYAAYGRRVAAAAPALRRAERWSLFDPDVRQAHFRALRQLTALAR